MDVQDDDGEVPMNNGHESPISIADSDSPDIVVIDSDSTSDEIGEFIYRAPKGKIQNILDRSISIDDDMLIEPLEPIRLSPLTNNCADTSATTSVVGEVLHCDKPDLHNEDTTTSKKKVSFRHSPQLTSYKEPDALKFHIILLPKLYPEDIMGIYQESCKRNNVIELDSIKSQINDIRDNTDRSAVLKLNNIIMTWEVLDTLEDICKVTNFSYISVTDCKFTPALIDDFFNILIYYECTSGLILSVDLDDLDAWKIFADLVTCTEFIRFINFKNITINEANMRLFMNALGKNTTVRCLKFDSCSLEKVPNFFLIESLATNSTIRELYLPKSGLYTKEAECISKLLTRNYFLKILDISNNVMGDRGLEQLAKGLCKQTENGRGLAVLIIFNNQLTEKSGKTISKIIGSCKNLRSLNIGFNKLTDNVIADIKENLVSSEILEGLGLQSTVLTCLGASILAEVIMINNSLQKLNLKGNKAIYIEGLMKISEALTNSKITAVDLDESNRSCNEPEKYRELVRQIKGICTLNELVADLIDETGKDEISVSKIMSDKTSLKCEPYYNTQPVSCNSRNTRSRFRVSKVSDSSSIQSRFKVVPVPNPSVPPNDGGGDRVRIPTVEEDKELQHFQNVRSSVSSLDSVESLPIPIVDLTESPPSTPEND